MLSICSCELPGEKTLIRAATWIIAAVLALSACFGLVACGGDDDEANGAATTASETTDETSAAAAGEETDDASGKQIEDLLAMHPIFPTKRFMNLAAQGNPEACSMLSDKGRRAMERAHGMPCPKVIRAAAAEREEPGLVIGGEFVPVDDFSDLEYPTTILVLNRERARISIEGERRPMRLSRYGRIWLIDENPLADIGTVS